MTRPLPPETNGNVSYFWIFQDYVYSITLVFLNCKTHVTLRTQCYFTHFSCVKKLSLDPSTHVVKHPNTPIGSQICTPPKFNSSPLKNGGWKTILSYWEGNFSGAMLNFVRVHVKKVPEKPSVIKKTTFTGRVKSAKLSPRMRIHNTKLVLQ